MGIQDGKKQFLEILFLCLYTLSSASMTTADDGVSIREVISGVQKDPFIPPGYTQLDFHPTHERALWRESLHRLSYPGTKRKYQEPRSGRKRRSEADSSASEVEEGSLDRRRKLYNEFLRKVLRRKAKKEKTIPKSEEKNETGADAEKSQIPLTSSPTPLTHSESRNGSLEKENQEITTDLQTTEALPTPETRRTYTLSPEQREQRRQILIARNKEERLQRLRELHHRQKAARSRKALTRRKSVRKNIKHGNIPRLSTNGKLRTRQKYTNHEKGNGPTEIVTRPTLTPRKDVGSTPEFQENRASPGKGKNKNKENVSPQKLTKVDNSLLVTEPTKANPFISVTQANDYLTRLDSVAERKKYPRKVILREEINDNTDSSTSPTPNPISSIPKSRQVAIEHEKRLNQKKNGNKIESTSGAKLTPRGRSRLRKSGAERSTRISKNDKKRIRRIRKNRLKLRQRKRRNNRKRKHRNRKNRTRHKMSSSTSPITTPVILTSTSKNQISSSDPNTFSSTSKRLQRKSEEETLTARYISAITPNRNTTPMTASALPERPNESEKVSSAATEPSVVNSFNEEAVMKDMQVISGPDPSVNSSVPVRDTIAVGDEELKRAGERNYTTTNASHQTDPPTATTSSSFPAKVSTAKVLGEFSRAANLTHMPDNSVVNDVGYSQELSNGSVNQLYNSSIWSEADDEIHSLKEDDSNTTKIERSITVGNNSTGGLLIASTSANIVTSSMEQVSQGATLDAKNGSTEESSLFTGVSKMATTPVPLISTPSANLSLLHGENISSTISQSEKQLLSMLSDNRKSIVPDNSDNENNNTNTSHNNSTYTQISPSTFLPTEMSSLNTSSTTIWSSSFSQSKTTVSPYASRWIAWAKRRRKQSKSRSTSGTISGQSSQKSEGMAQGSVALALAKAENEDSSQLASSRRPMTEPTTTKGPFIGYKTAYDFLSNQKGVKVSVLNEERRESRDINKFMGENMCEIFNKHYVPTRIGGKCV